MDKLLKVCCGVTNHTHATVTQMIKMGIDPSKIVVVDGNREKYGTLTMSDQEVTPSGPDVNYVAFDKLASDLNDKIQESNGEFDASQYILTRSKLGGLWYKSKQYHILGDRYYELRDVLQYPDYHIYGPQDSFIRDDNGHGGKIAHSFGDAFNTDKNFIVTPKCDFTKSNMLQVTIIDGEIRWDAVLSDSKFKDYDDISTVASHPQDFWDGYTPYLPDYDCKWLGDRDKWTQFYETMNYLARGLVEAFQITHGTFTTELLFDSYLNIAERNSHFYVETNFRPGDISAACSPSNWWYLRHEFRKHGLIK